MFLCKTEKIFLKHCLGIFTFIEIVFGFVMSAGFTWNIKIDFTIFLDKNCIILENSNLVL